MPLSPQRPRPAHTSAIPALHSNTPRTNLNNPEQIRTNPNIAKPPDQIGTPPESPPNTPKKQNPNTIAAPSPPLPFPNSSLPPSRGEVRWGVRGNARLPTALAYTPIAPPTIPAHSPPSPPTLRHSCAPTVILLRPHRHSCAPPSFLRRQEPTSPHLPSPPPSPIHPSPLPGGRLGGGCEATRVCQPLSPTPRSPLPLFPHLSRRSRAPSVIPAPFPPFLRRQEPTPTTTPNPFPNSSLPPGRGEVRWGVRGNARLPTALAYTPIAPPTVATHPPPSSPTLHHSRPLSTVVTHPPPSPPTLRHSRAPSVIPAQAGTQPTSVLGARPTIPASPASTLAVTPSDTPRTTLNKSEQTRTPPDAPTR